MKEEINAIMAEMAEKARELLEESKNDEECGEVRKAWAKDYLSRTLNYYFNRMREVLENE